MSGNEFWQWMHGQYTSDLYDKEEQALFHAERATTGGCDDDIAVRRLRADNWREVVPGGYADLLWENTTGFEVGDVVRYNHFDKSAGLVEAINKHGLLVARFGETTRYFWNPADCTLVSRPGSND